MSSILDALKRLEKEEEGPPSGPMHAPSWLDKPDVEQALSHRLAGFFLRRRRVVWTAAAVLTASTAAALLAVGGFFSVGGKEAAMESRVPAPAAAFEKTAANAARPKGAFPGRTAASADSRPNRIHKEASAGKAAIRPASNPAAPPPKSGSRTQAGRSLQQSPAGPDSAPMVGPRRPAAADRRLAAAPQAADAAVTGRLGQEKKTPRSETAANSGSGEEKTVAVADPRPVPLAAEAQTLPAESGLQLQAISWSDAPEKRIAVVNGRILKEGDRIEEYLLSEIHEDDVVFRYSGQRWKLGFQRR